MAVKLGDKVLVKAEVIGVCPDRGCLDLEARDEDNTPEFIFNIPVENIVIGDSAMEQKQVRILTSTANKVIIRHGELVGILNEQEIQQWHNIVQKIREHDTNLGGKL